ncbi:MarR family winged helix-turn-helix transcriptional regulator [Deferrisoma camini]|uniref:MarR family winged helix-turn-helix transcriptional regulator n=1 Tax=Deferrisoma camini TaxID=1035120 RepID=UPI00046D1DF8|nr:MarR family transcriptional regulator [Deferrisoma camini]
MGTHHLGTEEEVRALDAYIKLMRAANALTARVHRHLAEERLTISQFGALEALYHLGPLCQKDLGRKLLKTDGNITLVVDNLEKRGLVERRRDAKDRRYVMVHLSDEGRELIRRTFPRHVAGVVEALSVLDPSEQQELARLCRIVGKRAAD